MVKSIITASIFLFNGFLTLSAMGQEGWFSVVPSINETEIKTRSKDKKFQAMDFIQWEAAMAGEHLVNDKAPLAEWIQESAFDSAKECESFRAQMFDVEDKGRLNLEKNSITYEKAAQKESEAEEHKELETCKDMPEKTRNFCIQSSKEFWESMKQSHAAFNLEQLANFQKQKARRCVPASAVFSQKR